MAFSHAVLRVAEQCFVRNRSTCLLLGTGASWDLELTPDPGVVGQATVGFFILIVLVLWSPIPLDVKKLDWPRGAIEDMVYGA